MSDGTKDGKIDMPVESSSDRGKLGKRVVKPTYKVLCEKMEKCQNDRKVVFSKAKKLRQMIDLFMQNNDVRGVNSVFDEYGRLCSAAKGLHNEFISVMPMPPDEVTRQNTWFWSCISIEDTFHAQVELWLSEKQNGDNVGGVQTDTKTEVLNENSTNGIVISEEMQPIFIPPNDEMAAGNVVDVSPDDSSSNVKSKSTSSKGSGKSNTSEARIKAEAERAALLIKMAALKETQALDAQEEELRRKKQLVKLEAELAASAAKIAVLETASESGRRSKASGSGKSQAKTHMGPHPISTTLNPAATPFALPYVQQPASSVYPTHVQRQQLPEPSSQLANLYGDASLSQLAVPLMPNHNVSQLYPPTQMTPLGGAVAPTQSGTYTAHQPSQMPPQGGAVAQPPLHVVSAHNGPTMSQPSQMPPPDGAVGQPPSTLTAYTQPPTMYRPSQNPIPSGDLSNIMQRQNEITATLVQQQLLMSLPSRDIPAFDGDPLQYRSFIRAFEHSIESKANKADCLYFLEQFTKGQPQELVRSCLHMMPERGYALAKSLLHEHFGNEFKIATSYIEKALAWPSVKSEDVKALQAYSLFLRNCCNVMSELQHMQELDMPSNMRMVMTKLPYKFRERWRTTAHELLERQHRRAVFIDLVAFVERQVRILADPLFGDINDRPANKDGVSSRSKSQPPSKFSGAKSNSFATTVTRLDSNKPDSGSAQQVSQSAKTGSGHACVCCGRSHSLSECSRLKSKKHKDKISFLRERGLCYGCLCSGHMSAECDNRLTCQVCGKNHPTMLHIDKPNPATDPQLKGSTKVTQALKPTRTPAVTSAIPASTQTCGLTGAGSGESKLSILPVHVKSVKGDKIVQTYAFLDPGSSATFCSDRLMHALNVTGRQTNFLLRTMGQEKVVPTYLLRGLEVSGINEDTFHRLPEVMTQKKMPVTSDNIVTQEDVLKWPYLSNVQVPSIEANVDLLIGTNASKLLEPWEVINSRGNGPYAVKTILGWVVNGPLQASSVAENGLSVASVNRISVSRLEEMLSNQYNHDFNEQNSEQQGMSREDLRFLKIMDDSAQLVNGHYSVKMPFRNDQFALPNNLCVVKQRLLGLQRRFQRDATFHKEYTSFFTEVISNGYAEEVPQHQLDCEEGQVWYVPHHGVHHPRKGSLRVVFDCGAEFRGTSLNNELLQGPNLTSSLFGVLVRFRQEPVAFMGDIKSMFYQVKVPEEDRDFLRFLWWPEGNTSLDVVEHRMTVHLFGAVSSPSCASYALRKTAEDNSHHFAAEVVDTVKRNFYVDDCLKSLPTDKEAVVMVQALSEICQRGGFTLTKWTSNSRTVLQSVTEENRAMNLKELNLDRDELPMERALGLLWCVETDCFKFKMVNKEQPHTRRGLLSIVSSVYDPLGFLSPVTLPAKSILQELCRRGCKWDDVIPGDLEQQWTSWLKDLEKVKSFKVSRCIKPPGFGQHTCATLHHFSDASEHGFGTVTYLRLQNDTSIHVAFVLGKARVTPLKQITIPRLELTAAVLAVRVDQMLKAELQLTLEPSRFWTDSMSVIKYIKNEDKRFHTFVANRVSTIREVTEVSQWGYINTKDNPADDASRGLKAEELLADNRWIDGPRFLSLPVDEWPTYTADCIISSEDPEVKKSVTVNLIITDSPHATEQLVTYFSDWKKLKTAVAWFLKMKRILRELARKRKEMQVGQVNPRDRRRSPRHVQAEIERTRGALSGQALTLDDLLEAEMSIIRYCQKQRFHKEMTALSAGRPVARDSVVYKLDPRMEDGLLRVGGRLSRAAMPEESKHPLILSKDQHVSTLILRSIHQQLGHSGRNQTLSQLRKRFWITNANSAVRKIIGNCCFCKLYSARVGEQKMADLPKERLLPDLPPFTNVGVDYFGPLEVKRGRSICKRYGVIFTCLSSRAVHLEVAPSLDTDACINAIRRFISRRGQVSQLRSDNGTNFVGAERELKDALAHLNQERLKGALLQDGIRWSFNPPGASHHGGVWERIIRMVRKILTSVLHLQTLDDDGLHTVLCEVESILNDRPITKLSDDPNDLEALTPNHILLMKGKPVLPPGLFVKEDLYAKRRWRQVQYIAGLFWKRWVQEYLPLLQERQKWSQPKRNFEPGDIVVIVDSTAPRGSWLLGRVLETFPDKNGLVRSVRLRTKTSELERPVAKLCLLHEATVSE